MKGDTLKATLRGYGITNKELASMMGISEANLSQMLSKDDVRTGLVEKVSEVTNIPLGVFYGLPTASVNGDNSTAVAGNNIKINAGKLIDEVAAQRRLTETAMEQNSRLLRIIENMQIKH